MPWKTRTWRLPPFHNSLGSSVKRTWIQTRVSHVTAAAEEPDSLHYCSENSKMWWVINTLNLGNFREGNEKPDLVNICSWVKHCARKQNVQQHPSILTLVSSFLLENSQEGRRLPIVPVAVVLRWASLARPNVRSCAKTPPATKSLTTHWGPVFSTEESKVRKTFKYHSSQVNHQRPCLWYSWKVIVVSICYIHLPK